MNWELNERVAVVTGAASGIGAATAKLLLQSGARVVAADLEVPPESELRDDQIWVSGDLSTASGCEAPVKAAIDTFGTIDIVINNVGVGPARTGFLSVSDADWMSTLELNLMSMVRVSRAALPHLVGGGGGSIVSLTSTAARQVEPAVVDYAASKAAILNTSKAIANEFGPQGVRSNVVSPGPTRTPMWDRPGGFIDHLAERYSMAREEAVEHYATDVRKIPTGRLGSPEEVAAVILFLASPLASQVTGSDYRVDGGSIFHV